MKYIAVVLASLSAVAISATALAAPVQDQDNHQWNNGDHRDDHHDHGDNRDDHRDHGYYRDDHHDHGWHAGWDRHYGRGERLPDRYRGHDYYVDDYARYHLYAPRPGYRWVRGDGGEFVMVGIATGIIVDSVIFRP